MELRVKLKKGNYLSSSFPIENGLKQGDALSPLLFNFCLEYAIRKVQISDIMIEIIWTESLKTGSWGSYLALKGMIMEVKKASQWGTS